MTGSDPCGRPPAPGDGAGDEEGKADEVGVADDDGTADCGGVDDDGIADCGAADDAEEAGAEAGAVAAGDPPGRADPDAPGEAEAPADAPADGRGVAGVQPGPPLGAHATKQKLMATANSPTVQRSVRGQRVEAMTA